MDFTTLPPEITSALIHSGPGAESLIAASAAWQKLGTTLEDSAESYGAALSSLAGTWHGPSSATMVQAVEPYVTWVRTTAQQSQQVASSAQAAAAAFNSVRAAVVPTAEVAANRTQLAQLLATNGFGRNLPAIAETEAEYQSMWANNSAAMSRYQAASAQASTLPLFASPTSATNPAGLATQAGAVPAASSSAASNAAATSVTPAAATPVNLGFSDPTTGYFGLANVYANQFVSSGFPINLLSYLAQSQSAQALQGVSGSIGQGLSEGEGAFGAPGGAAAALGALGAGGLGHAGGLGGALGAAGLGEINTSAAIGKGVSIGNLTAPPAVVDLLQTSQTPVELASAASPLDAGGAGLPMLPPLMPPPLSAGSGWRKRKAQKYEDMEIGAELKGKVVRPPPSAG
ncbi:MAG: PPE family protein [Mycobacterium sp.]|uniref:PPE family protein n=1 Tax=Mycobacterium sp. TaxID=1785 RepID=UPI003C66B6A5